jgi:hypothetical protein
MDKLLDCIDSGEMPSMSSLCCAIDLIILQVIKEPPVSDRTDSLKLRVQSLLESLHEQAVQSDPRDKSAKVIKFFCEYRMPLLGLHAIPEKLKKEKGNVALSSKLTKVNGMTLNEYIIAELFDNESVDTKLIELQTSVSRVTRE